MRTLSVLIFIIVFSVGVNAQDWHKMTENELKVQVPEKAPVIKENIETEFRTASGITNGRSTIFGIIIITAGYEADGKYTHFLRSGTNLRVGSLDLAKGDYIFGYRRLDTETLRVTFYKASTGETVGEIKAIVEQKKGGIYSFLITPPVAKAGKIYIGRFTFVYLLK